MTREERREQYAAQVGPLLERPNAYLYRGHLFALGLGRRAVDVVMNDIGRDVPGLAACRARR